MRGLWGTESSQLDPFAPRAGRRCRQADEGRAAISQNPAASVFLSKNSARRTAVCHLPVRDAQ
ncbi:hypothetical protein EFR00_08675 [Rhizobium sophoriradicis]|nr:hypothetical protein EFR00_08675 [Rhizobium sophoriradicis]